jgi:hypothetical protein
MLTPKSCANLVKSRGFTQTIQIQQIKEELGEEGEFQEVLGTLPKKDGKG